MHTIELHNGTMLLVEVKNGAEVFHNIADNRLEVSNTFSLHEYNIPLPSGSWHLVGITPLSEEQAGEVVELGEFGYIDYSVYFTVPDSPILQGLVNSGASVQRFFTTATKPFHSLLVSKGVDVSKRWAVLKNDKK